MLGLCDWPEGVTGIKEQFMNGTTVSGGRDFRGQPVHHLAQFEHFQGWRSTASLGDQFQCLTVTVVTKCFLYFLAILHVPVLCLLPLILPLHLRGVSGSVFCVPSHEAVEDSSKVLPDPSPQGWATQLCQLQLFNHLGSLLLRSAQCVSVCLVLGSPNSGWCSLPKY